MNVMIGFKILGLIHLQIGLQKLNN